MENYGTRVTVVEPHGLEVIGPSERHGRPFDLFSLWFAANAETATFAVGILTIALYGTSYRGAALGIVIGNVLAYSVVALLSQLGPRYGRPQMMISRRVFGATGNTVPAVLSFLAGVGWFAISSMLGSQALALVLHVDYYVALAIALVTQIVIAVYGHNMIHFFEKFAGIALTLGFFVLSIAIFNRAQLAAPFDAHAPYAGGGEFAGIVYSAALAFSYAVGWGPSASDYSRYLPLDTSRRAIFGWAFLGGFLPSTALELAGAAAVTATIAPGLADATPAQLIQTLFGSGALARVGLVTVVFGTLSANCLNLYSGAMSALTAWDPRRRPSLALRAGLFFFALTALVATLARASDPAAASLGSATILAAALAVGILSALVVRYTLVRWQAALGIGIVGGALALAGADPAGTAHLYSSFLEVLSLWAAPWAAVVLVRHRIEATERTGRMATLAWCGGIAASLVFSQQAWFTGPLAQRFPALGDISYFVGFAVAYVLAHVL
jgi:NCS1 family nucleobase:cation symporter-1